MQDRRRRPRLQSRTQGWVTFDEVPSLTCLPDEEDGQEVWIENVSRHGIGFISAEPMAIGTRQHIRVGRGPMSRCKSMHVVFCQRLDDNVYRIGVEFLSAVPLPLAKAG